MSEFISENIIVGAGKIAFSPRAGSLPAVTVLASPAATDTTFAVSAAHAALLRVGDRLTVEASPAFDVDEAEAAPVITDISDDAEPVITVSPAFSGGAPATTALLVKVLWKNLGATDGGIEIQGTQSVIEHFIDQSKAAVNTTDDKLEMKVMAPLAEATLAHFALALGQADPVSGKVGIKSTATSRQDRFLVIGPGPDGATRYGVFHKCKNMGTVSLKNSKNDKAIIALDLKVLSDTTMTNDLGELLDVE